MDSCGSKNVSRHKFLSAVDKLTLGLLIPDNLLKDELSNPDTLRIKVGAEYEARQLRSRQKLKSSREEAFNTGLNDSWKKTKNPKDTSNFKCH